jgi:hypothetical protein
MTASNYEDIFQVRMIRLLALIFDVIFLHCEQCAIPVFDGLLPEPHNTTILELLFVATQWHGLAKLRMQTDLTLDIMDDVTVSLGKRLRQFVGKTCSTFKTRELLREANARIRRQAKPKKRNTHRDDTPGSAPGAPRAAPKSLSQPNASRREKTLNLHTYKYHALGDYPASIRMYGTADSYSTEPVRIVATLTCIKLMYYQGELEHRTSKSRYTRTSRKNFLKQMAQIERRQARIRRIKDRIYKSGNAFSSEQSACNLDTHTKIGVSENDPQHIGLFLQKYTGDPAVKVMYSV